MITSILLSTAFIFSAPFVEEERIGIEISLSYVFIDNFQQPFGVGVDMILVTGERLDASLGFTILRSKGESIYKEPLTGTELISSISTKFLTLTGFELNYVLRQRKTSAFAGIGVNWIYFHEQAKNIYTAPGWKITYWGNYQGYGYCFAGIIGLRYILKPSVSIENKIEIILGNFYYPVLNERIATNGLSISIGIRL